MYGRGSKREFKREPLTDSEYNRLIQSCQTPEERLVVLGLLDTGLRVAELADLKADQIEWQALRVILRGKGDKRRVVPLTTRVVSLLEPRLLHLGRFGMGVRKIQLLVKAVANRAVIAKSVTPHVLRHTFAIRSLQAGVSIRALQEILGHEDLQTTAIYLRMTPEEALREFRTKVSGYQREA